MVEYFLKYANPRFSEDGTRVEYDIREIKIEHRTDHDAIKWARDYIPLLHEVVIGDLRYAPRPLVLWRIDPPGRIFVWESEPGLALRQ